MRFIKFISLLLLVSVSLASNAQEISNNRKAAKQERKLERQERRESRKEKRAAKKKNSAIDTTVRVELEPIALDNAPSTHEDSSNTLNQDVINQPEEISSSNNESLGVINHTENALSNSEQSNKHLSSDQNTIPSTNEMSSDNSDDDNHTGAIFIIVVVICIGIFKVIKWFRMHNCSNCKKHFCMVVVNEEFLGHTKKKREKNSNGEYFDIYYSNIKVTRQCKYCGHKAFYTEERKGK